VGKSTSYPRKQSGRNSTPKKIPKEKDMGKVAYCTTVQVEKTEANEIAE
jgi:hypothetical protein